MANTSLEVLETLSTMLGQPAKIRNDKISITSHSLEDVLELYKLLKQLEANEESNAVMPGGILTNVLVPAGAV